MVVQIQTGSIDLPPDRNSLILMQKNSLAMGLNQEHELFAKMGCFPDRLPSIEGETGKEIKCSFSNQGSYSNCYGRIKTSVRPALYIKEII